MSTRPAAALALVSVFLLGACANESGELPSGLEEAVAVRPSFDAQQFSDWSSPANLGSMVNSEEVELTPFISRDGRSLYFGSTRPGGFGGLDIWVSQRASADEPWGPPQNLGPNINSPFDDNAPALSLDGHRLFFQSNRPGGFGGNDLYVARRRSNRDDLGWRPAKNLGSAVNTAANDAGAAYFEDDVSGTVTLYFNSNRPGGLGGTDIYASTQLLDETFGSPVLVSELSSPFADQGVAVRRDGLELFMNSNRSGTLGGMDLYVATRTTTSDPWSTPVNLGSVVNSENFDAGPTLSFDGTALYFHSALRPGTVGPAGSSTSGSPRAAARSKGMMTSRADARSRGV